MGSEEEDDDDDDEAEEEKGAEEGAGRGPNPAAARWFWDRCNSFSKRRTEKDERKKKSNAKNMKSSVSISIPRQILCTFFVIPHSP